MSVPVSKCPLYVTPVLLGFPGGSGSKSACNAGELGLISGLGGSPGEGIGYLLQYSWASMMPQLVKNLPAMWEIWVRSLGWGDLLEKEMATHPSVLAWRIPWPRIYCVIWLLLPIQEHGIAFNFFESSLISLMTV